MCARGCGQRDALRPPPPPAQAPADGAGVIAQGSLFAVDGPSSLDRVNDVLAARHYLGPTFRGWAWEDRFGVMVIAHPTSRRLPGEWLEITRWCLYGERNGGSKQFSRVRRWVAERWPRSTTIVSYSDPSAGHTGALYRACGWWYAPTWHRLRPPPSGNGEWTDGECQSVKDRWVYPLRKDAARVDVLSIKDAAITAKLGLDYREPGGFPYRVAMDFAA